MEPFIHSRDQARDRVKMADYMLSTTYPMLKDPKVLLSVLQNIYLALKFSILSVLEYEFVFKRVPPFTRSFEQQFTLFKTHVVDRYTIDRKWMRFINEIRELLKDHRDATTEFTRKGQFVMANNNYTLRTISEATMKKDLAEAKTFVEELSQLVTRNDAIIRRR